jgi:hypothetical protein
MGIELMAVEDGQKFLPEAQNFSGFSSPKRCFGSHNMGREISVRERIGHPEGGESKGVIRI